MPSEDMMLTTRIRRVLVQHRIDVSRINMTVTNGAVRLTGAVLKDDGNDVHPGTMNVVDQKLEEIPALKRITYEFENLINTGDAWVQIGRSRGIKGSDRLEDMLVALRIRQILISHRLDAAHINITVTNGTARLYGRVELESGQEVLPAVLSAIDSKIEGIKGLQRCVYEFENVFHSGDAWIPINRRRRRDRKQSGKKIGG